MAKNQRRFGDLEKAALLKAIGECRKASIIAADAALFDRKDVKQSCGELQKVIDDLAGKLTGNPEYFWGKAHSSNSISKLDRRE